MDGENIDTNNTKTIVRAKNILSIFKFIRISVDGPEMSNERFIYIICYFPYKKEKKNLVNAAIMFVQ